MRPQRILLVDDDDLVAMTLEYMLLDAGHDVLLALSADEALRAIEMTEHPFEAVVTDYWLPPSNGLMIISAVRRRWPEAKAVILTGDTLGAPENLAGERITWLAKPVSIDALIQSLA